MSSLASRSLKTSLAPRDTDAKTAASHPSHKPTSSNTYHEAHPEPASGRSPSSRKRTSHPSNAEPKRRVFAGIAHERHGEAWGASEEALATGESERAVPLKQRRLPFNLKEFIVIQNAGGATPSEVVARVRTEWGWVVTPQQVEAYDPTKVTGAALGAELKELFRHVQREHQSVIMRAGIADQKWRLVMLHQIVVKAYEKGAFRIALKALDQAARECGGAYTNKTKVEVDDKRALLGAMLKCDPNDLPSVRRVIAEHQQRTERKSASPHCEHERKH